MCGIVGYVGDKEAAGILIDGLKRLEYRGYDSAGLAVVQPKGIKVVKKRGKVGILDESLKKAKLKGGTGCSHTRWATHGIPSKENAHPHLSCDGKIAVVHNGIIENFHALRDSLIKEGHKFRSQTDTEVIVHLIEKFYRGDLGIATRRALKLVRGAYAIAVVSSNEPGRLIGARCDSPLVVGIGKGENFLASDAPAILAYTKKVIYLGNFEIVSLTKDSVKVTDLSGKEIPKETSRITWDAEQAKKSGYPHFMLKEIFEQPQVLRGILDERLKKARVSFQELKISGAELKKFKQIAIVACGTAYHAGFTGKYILEEKLRVPVWVDTSSEFRYRGPIVGKSTLVIVISQSGETADTLAGLREAKARGAKVLAICNVLGSSIAREADGVIYTHAGPEIAVASTKAYTAQMAILYLLAIYLGKLRNVISSKDAEKLVVQFKETVAAMRLLLGRYKKKRNTIATYAKAFRSYYLKHKEKGFFLYLGRNINYPNALEGALKLKEISYISAEGYPAGEMKHGPIALIDENPWVVAIATRSRVYEKMVSNIEEIKARGGIVIAIVTDGDKEIERQGVNYVIEVPVVEEFFSPLLVVVPLQLFAYYMAREFGYDIDQPRNLAKSVTVE
ncbi:MAG: glutamine--fructose-6-phosphate transaminase (isomerizing) [Candidatus Omnitrophica bacterium]|nr:glutamine--fructose-6-phosphate transaminase (isomerizing) [Candidatus Omnitrophota bacterium]